MKIIFLSLIISFFGCNSKLNRENTKDGFHFTVAGMNLLQPVSLLFFEGKYHLFFEGSANQNEKAWGLVQSKDLIEWERPAIPVFGDADSLLGKGSIVHDLNNTSGLGKNNLPLVAVYPASAGNETRITGLNLMYSIDNGINWDKYDGNPIQLENYYFPVNDVNVIWHEETGKWVMLVLSGFEVRFYSSDNLIDWEYLSQFGDEVYGKSGRWTKLDFFPLEVNNTNQFRWVLFISSDSSSPNEGSGIQYFVGDFDGYVYKANSDKAKWLDNGSDNYAGIVLSEYLLNSKPTYFIGSIYNSKYSQLNKNENNGNVFTLPRTLTLKDAYDGLSIHSGPVTETETKGGRKQLLRETRFSGELKIKKPQKLPLEIDLKFDANDRLYLDLAEVFGVKLTTEKGNQLLIGYHVQKAYFFILDPALNAGNPGDLSGFDYAPYVSNKQAIDVKIIIDHHSVELFAMNGLITLTRKYTFSDDRIKIALYTEVGNVTLKEGYIRR